MVAARGGQRHEDEVVVARYEAREERSHVVMDNSMGMGTAVIQNNGSGLGVGHGIVLLYEGKA